MKDSFANFRSRSLGGLCLSLLLQPCLAQLDTAPPSTIYFDIDLNKAGFLADFNNSSDYIISQGGGSPDWYIGESPYSESSLVSGLIGNSQESSFMIKSNCSYLAFDYWTSTEGNFDLLTVTLDRENILASSGFQDYKFEQTIEPGEHQIEFKYTKDSSNFHGTDQVGIDNLEIRTRSRFETFQMDAPVSGVEGL